MAKHPDMTLTEAIKQAIREDLEHTIQQQQANEQEASAENTNQ